ncbi:alpha/beta hydrolase family protein [Qipengyuania qiaonensis]|uniref:Alpha/beta fold hydrolase n=1 Tax=Qipengyuania qiaonensis TaxID=2867240 RepID=A0ABS7J7R4_9SPHN|nr:alpha/beta fold hydrolase [Qipengyuania qiaonensis]MBX7482010.1 alpha/beta fold hydrolase [Qipengyuania qiaonensis]
MIIAFKRLAGLVMLSATCFSTPLQAQVPETPAAVPWAVPPTIRIELLSLTFDNLGTSLSGILYVPEGARELPVAVVLHSAAGPSQDAALYEHLKQMLPPLGMAVFVFDRRGSGASGGDDPRSTDFDVLASDAVAARARLAILPQIDPSRIGFWGLSQGGWIALLAAARMPDAAFAISVSAPITAADVQMNYAVENILRIKGYSQGDIDEAIDARRAVDDYTRGHLDRASAERFVAAARLRPWWKHIYLEGNIDDPTWLGQIEADPLRALDGSRVPTLMIFGQADPWIPVGASIAALDGSAARRPNVSVHVVAGADHMMMLGVDPKEQIDPAAFDGQRPDASEYFGLLASWLERRGLTTRTATQPSPR